MENNLLKNLEKLNTKYKPIVFEEEKEKNNVYYDTNVYTLNYLLTKQIRSGFPAGRIITVVGDAGSGKTALALQFATIKDWDIVVYIQTNGEDAEKSLIDKFAGVSAKLIKQPCDSYEDLKKIMEEILNYLIIHKNEKALIILDSVVGINLEENNDAGYAGGRRASIFKGILREYANKLKNLQSNLVLITQYYQNPQVTFGDNRTIGGGLSVMQFSHLILKVTASKKDSEIVKGSILGLQEHAINVNVVKSRFGTQYAEADFIFDVYKGFSRTTGMFELCRDLGLIVKKGRFYYMPCLLTHKEEEFKFRDVNENDIGFYSSQFEEKINEKNLEKILQKIEEINSNLYKEEVRKIIIERQKEMKGE